MANKTELAQSLTVEQLRALAAEHEVDLTGKTGKDDIAEAVATGVTKDNLQTAVDDASDAPADTPTATTEPPSTASSGGVTVVKDIPSGISPVDTEALAKAGQSAADLELATPQLQGGPSRIVKASPEMPTAAQVEASEGEHAGIPEAAVVITDGDEDKSIELRPDDAALLVQRNAANLGLHPKDASPGHWSNPNLAVPTEEEIEADQKAYAARIA